MLELYEALRARSSNSLRLGSRPLVSRMQHRIQVLQGVDEAVIVLVPENLVVEHLVPDFIRQRNAFGSLIHILDHVAGAQ